MKVSIIIPAHNEEASIENTLKAVFKQDYPDFEIIVVNNNSSDRTSEIAEGMGVKVLLETRKGTQWARECGRKEATGEIIANLDADCLPDPKWITNGVEHFSSKKVVAVTGPYDYYDGTTFFRKASLLIQRNIYPFFNSLLQMIGRSAVVIGGNVFLRSDTLSKVGGYNTSITFYGDDTDTAKRMIKRGKVAFDKDLIVKTSARRFKQEGTLKIFVIYLYHFFKGVFVSLR
jgi:glycosyltransferase involved in cell wall biosynthesis